MAGRNDLQLQVRPDSPFGGLGPAGASPWQSMSTDQGGYLSKPGGFGQGFRATPTQGSAAYNPGSGLAWGKASQQYGQGHLGQSGYGAIPVPPAGTTGGRPTVTAHPGMITRPRPPMPAQPASPAPAAPTAAAAPAPKPAAPAAPQWDAGQLANLIQQNQTYMGDATKWVNPVTDYADYERRLQGQIGSTFGGDMSSNYGRVVNGLNQIPPPPPPAPAPTSSPTLTPPSGGGANGVGGQLDAAGNAGMIKGGTGAGSTGSIGTTVNHVGDSTGMFGFVRTGGFGSTLSVHNESGVNGLAANQVSPAANAAIVAAEKQVKATKGGVSFTIPGAAGTYWMNPQGNLVRTA